MFTPNTTAMSLPSTAAVLEGEPCVPDRLEGVLTGEPRAVEEVLCARLLRVVNHYLGPSTEVPDWVSPHYANHRLEIKANWNRTPFLSNFFPFRKVGGAWVEVGELPRALQLTVHYEGRLFRHVEGAYQYAKALFLEEFVRQVASAQSSSQPPVAAKDRFPEMRAGWFTTYWDGGGAPWEGLSAMDAKKRGTQGVLVERLGAPDALVSKAQAKRIFKAFNQAWRKVNVQKMENILRIKFGNENPFYRDLLLATDGVDLAEAKFRSGSVWEVGGTLSLQRALGGAEGPPSGLGLLGDLLMRVRRDLLRSETR